MCSLYSVVEQRDRIARLGFPPAAVPALMFSVDADVLEPTVRTGREAQQLITVMRYSHCLLDKERVLHPASGG